ncbi:MAG TPA: (d)CMP kinase [bacterium]|nr:(d)CMP kinase [bacterium]HQG44222.1 (d)CMP kinase [bacterium]HQI49153.1 (d)CMP kinase [bacterium]HQJ66065.1 (d)CMP kinase [bacterium]
MSAAIKKVTITIDGPAGSGKSTTARRVAARLGYLYLDSGALYRAVTLAALRRQCDFHDSEALAQIARTCRIELIPGPEGLLVLLEGEDVSTAIRTPEVAAAIGPVAANAGVRQALLAQQRRMGERGGIVAEGRDMGSVVFPRAEVKIYLVASIEERARRRQKELAERGRYVELDDLVRSIRKRDEDDSQRDVSPLIKPEDALELDTTRLSIDEQVDWIVAIAKERGAVK